MTKIELAKMLGLKSNYTIEVYKWQIEDLLNTSYATISEDFNAGIEVVIEKGDLGKDCLDITAEDLIKDEDIKVCIKQCEDLLWERAAYMYLSKIQDIVESINIR